MSIVITCFIIDVLVVGTMGCVSNYCFETRERESSTAGSAGFCTREGCLFFCHKLIIWGYNITASGIIGLGYLMVKLSKKKCTVEIWTQPYVRVL